MFEGEKKIISNFLPIQNELKTIFHGYEEIDCIDVYVHGSWADNTKTPFSDLDDLIIIHHELIHTKNEVKNLIKWLNKVEMHFCKIDPLQHHGHWIIYNYDLQKYDESYIPFIVLDRAILVKGRNSLNVTVDISQTKKGLERNIEMTLNNMQYLYRKYQKKTINIYEMKGLVGSFLLMPAYMFQFTGNCVSKREAINRKDELFSSQSCLVIEKCSTIRTDWHYVTNLRGFILLSNLSSLFLNPWLFRFFSKKFSPKFPSHLFPILEKQEVESFIDEVKRYCDEYR